MKYTFKAQKKDCIFYIFHLERFINNNLIRQEPWTTSIYNAELFSLKASRKLYPKIRNILSQNYKLKIINVS